MRATFILLLKNFLRKKIYKNTNGNNKSLKNILYTFIQYIHQYIFGNISWGDLTTDSLVAVCYSEQKLYKQNIFQPIKFLDCKMFDIGILHHELQSPFA